VKPLERFSARRLVLIAVLCLASVSANAGDKLLVYTVNYPLQYFAERIAGEYARVEFPAPADVDPASWKPDAETIRGYQQADLILLNGAGYAQWVNQVSLPRRRQVDTSASFAAVYIPGDAILTDGDGSGGEHAPARTAFTTWLDFFQAAQQAEAVMQALSKQRPQQQAEFERNYAALKQDLMALDLDMQQLVANQPDKPLFASHPVYHYLARRYLLHLQSVAWEPSVMPTEQAWEQLVLAQEAFPAEWMLWQDQPSAEISGRLQSMGVGVAVFRPCGNRPQQGDFMGAMRRNLENLKSVFPGTPP
jgi:zinc transport system substrate-binding protein